LAQVKQVEVNQKVIINKGIIFRLDNTVISVTITKPTICPPKGT